VERLLITACGEDVAGRLHTARSRNDIDMTMYRMRQREWIAGLLQATLELRSALIDVAARHRETVFRRTPHAAGAADDDRTYRSA
jgi:argininosuccinate lyase